MKKIPKIKIDFSKVEKQVYNLYNLPIIKPTCPIGEMGLTPGTHYLWGSPKTGRSYLNLTGVTTGRFKTPSIDIETARKLLQGIADASTKIGNTFIQLQEHSLLAKNQAVKFNNQLIIDNKGFIYKVIFMNGIDEESLDMAGEFIKSKVDKGTENGVEMIEILFNTRIRSLDSKLNAKFEVLQQKHYKL